MAATCPARPGRPPVSAARERQLVDLHAAAVMHLFSIDNGDTHESVFAALPSLRRCSD